MKKLVITAAVVVSAAFGGLAFVQAQDAADTAAQEVEQEADTVQGAAVSALPGGYDLSSTEGQPIAFPHDVHAGTYQIECQYCHFSAERSFSAGIPPVASCMGCHNFVGGETETAQAEIGKLREYWQTGTPIPWRRIYQISEHAHFPHYRHVNAGVTCQQCHGEVQEMGVITERAPEWGDGKMGWCISCHVDNDVSVDCTVCHY